MPFHELFARIMLTKIYLLGSFLECNIHLKAQMVLSYHLREHIIMC